MNKWDLFYGNGRIKIKNSEAAKIAIDEELAEKDSDGWWIADIDSHRPATAKEAALLDRTLDILQR